jgi:E3 UFM1-protein ligase 1
VAIEHELNIKFIEKFVAENIEKLQAELVGNQLITREYTRLKKAKILGFLSAINNPINTDLFLKATGIENRNIEDIINELIAEGKLKGKYQNSYYVPDRFTANQKRIVTQFYENNGYIDAEMLQKKFLVNKPEEWIEKNLNSQFVKLEKMYFKP